MKIETKEKLIRGKQKAIAAGDRFSILAVILQPLLLGGIFFRVWYMKGAPGWYYIINGLMFIGALIQMIYFIFIGLFGAIRNDFRKEKKTDE